MPIPAVHHRRVGSTPADRILYDHRVPSVPTGRPGIRPRSTGGFSWSASWRPVINYTPSAMSARDEIGPGATRIDRWLFGVRLFKSRSSAADAVGGGRVHLNGERVKPSHGVKPGDTVTFTRSAVVFECVVAAVPLRRGPASEAARCYDETPASIARREVFAARMKVAAGLTPRPDDRPDKHDRRLLRRLRGRN